MGNLFNKKEHVIGPHTKVGLDSNCQHCGKFFSKHSSYNELNKHKESCHLESKKKNLQGLMKELIRSSNDLEEIEKIEEATKIIRNTKSNSGSKNKLPEVGKFEKLNKYGNGDRADNKGNKDKIDKLEKIEKVEKIDNKQKKCPFVKHEKKKSEINLKHPNNILFDAKELISDNNLKKNKPHVIKKESMIDNTISNLAFSYIKDLPFDEKVLQFKKHLNSLKVDWREGYCTLTLDRDNFLKQSIYQFNQIDPYKELHINFKGEISHDAGGIIREWFTIVFKELQKNTLSKKIKINNLDLFELSETADFSYKIYKEAESTIENLDTFHFVGKIIAKALLDNLTVNTCFNKMIYKMMLEEEIMLDDLVFIDKPLYHSLRELLKIERVSELDVYFVVQYEINNELVSDELIPNGSNIQVTNQNMDEYIIKRIEHIQQKDKIFINEIKSGLYSLIPDKLIKIFNSDELELLLNGQPFIDIIDWKINTIYKGYNENSNVIRNFWYVLSSLSQEELARFLQFCTGSSRVPIGGFSALESNRGNISKFCITKVIWNCESRNFIRAHTCFNRLDMPEFPNLSSIQEAVNFIIENEILGFGVE